MDKNNALIAEIYETWAEWIEHMTDEQANCFIINALATIATQERDKAIQYKMALKRCELMHK